MVQDYNERIRKARLKAGLTQNEVADCAGITQASYCFIERGVKRPSIETACLIAKALNVSLDSLFLD